MKTGDKRFNRVVLVLLVTVVLLLVVGGWALHLHQMMKGKNLLFDGHSFTHEPHVHYAGYWWEGVCLLYDGTIMRQTPFESGYWCENNPLSDGSPRWRKYGHSKYTVWNDY